MAENVTRRVADARSFMGKLWKLSAPYWWTTDTAELEMLGRTVRVPERWLARGLLATIIGFSVFMVWVSTLFNAWYGRFYNALEQRDEATFWAELLYFTVLAFIHIIVAVYALWIRQLLLIRWRRWLTNIYVNDWLGNRTYYRMELVDYGTDNPEQRIEFDINVFTQQTLALSMSLFSNTLTLVTFSVILWNLSTTLVVPLFGGIKIPGLMMWAAVLYAIIGSWATWKVGRNLIGINFQLERYNADFRYRMVRVRDNAESIALYDGEPDEGRRLINAFGNIFNTYWEYMRYNKRLTWLTSFYGQAAIIFPLLIVGPSFFMGLIQFGAILQISRAFDNVQGPLSWFVDSFDTIADWKATTDRLTTFTEAMHAVRARARAETAFEVEAQPASNLGLSDVEVALPNGRVLLEDVDLTINRGERVVIQGPSGSGKTTLFRVLAGLWPFGRGRLRVPKGAKVLFLPQKPYIPMSTLREALCFPDKPEQHNDREIAAALAECELPGLVERLDESENWSMILSPGEQQRLAFARALLVKPDWLFLDEATSAVDDAMEQKLYTLIRERLPEATLVSIAHKPSVRRFHEALIEIDPEARRVLRGPLPAE